MSTKKCILGAAAAGACLACCLLLPCTLQVRDGEGATLNVPLPAHTDDAGYAEAIQGRVIPALRGFAPDILLVSAGFDAWQHDPLGGMQVTEEGFRDWGRWLRDLADEVCGGRLLAVLEGGYDLANLPRLVEANLQGYTQKD